MSAPVEHAFAGECAALARMCVLPDDDLKELAKSDRLAESLLKSPRSRAAWRMLRELPAEQLTAVLRGDRVLNPAIADLPEPGKDLVRLSQSAGQSFVLTPDGARTPAPDPTHIQVFRMDDGLLAAPSLLINCGSGASYAGGVALSRCAVAELTPNWVQPDETHSDPWEERVVPRPSTPPGLLYGMSLTQRL